MNDEVIGVAILTRTVPQELVVVCRKADGNCFRSNIPAYPLGGSKPAEHAWQYVINGDYLEITPSLHIQYQLPPDQTWITRFHNTYNWRVRFQWADSIEPQAVWEECRQANPDITFNNAL